MYYKLGQALLELGFEFLQSRRWFRKLSVFFKIIKSESLSYLYHLIPKTSTSYFNSENFPPIKANDSFFKNTFFPSNIIEWNKLDANIRSSPSYKLFKKRIGEFIRTHTNRIFDVPNSLGLTYLTRHVGFSICENKNFVIIFGIY